MLKGALIRRVSLFCVSVLLIVVCCIPACADQKRLPLSDRGTMELYDDAGILTNSEETELIAYGEKIAQETGFVVFVKTTFGTDGKEIRRYIADEYEKAGYNDTLPAIMLAIDMDYREIAVATTQSYVDYFPVSKTDDMVDDVTDYLRDGRYADGVRAFLDDAHQTIVNYGVKPVGTIVMVSLGAGVLIAALVVGCMIVAHPKVSNSQISATAYLKDGRVQLHTKRDRFVRTFTTSRTIQKNNSGGSGGSFSSSSGGSYSGSSGRF